MMVRIGAAVAALLAVSCSGGNQAGEAGSNSSQTAAADRACASSQTYDRLKELAFDEAARIRGDDSEMLNRISGEAVATMEDPQVRERDEELNVTTCSGRFVIQLPPGSGNAFDGEPRLSAQVDYAAQTAPDGTGLVYQMQGAEPIIYKLATVGGLARTAIRPAPTPASPPAVVKSPAAGVRTADVSPRPQPQPRASAPEPPAASASARPSFDCRSPRSRSERMICGNGSLAALDRRMSSLFYSALARASPRARSALRSSRNRFLSFRESCGDEACVAQAYRDRMDEIEDLARVQ
jgi:hypothetical protein